MLVPKAGSLTKKEERYISGNETRAGPNPKDQTVGGLDTQDQMVFGVRISCFNAVPAYRADGKLMYRRGSMKEQDQANFICM